MLYHYSLLELTYGIVLLGKTTAGKSSLANTIFGEDVFKIHHTPFCGTRECQAESKSVHGRRITVIDTPGFFETDRPEEEVKGEIMRMLSILECAPGPHVFFIVLKVEEFREQDRNVIANIFHHFSEEVLKYAVVVFTHGDHLQDGMKIEEFVDQNKCLSDLVKKRGGRCHVIDNTYQKNNQLCDYRSNEFQVSDLLSMTDKIVMENKGGCFTNGMLQKVEEMKKQEVEKIRQSQANLTEEEIREEANDRVYNILNRLRGIRTVDFMGALFGVAVMVAAVITALQA